MTLSHSPENNQSAMVEVADDSRPPPPLNNRHLQTDSGHSLKIDDYSAIIALWRMLLSVWRKADQMKLHVEYEQEEDGRWIAEIPELPGVMCYGMSRNDAAAKVGALALRAIADSAQA